MLAGRSGKTLRNLAVERRFVTVLFHVVVFVTRNEEVVVRDDVDCADAVARELGRGALRRDDPNMLRTGQKSVLDLAIDREDAESVKSAAVEAALRAARFENSAIEIWLEAGHESQRCRIVSACETRDAAAAVDPIAALRGGSATGQRKVGVGSNAIFGRFAKHESKDLFVASNPAGPAEQCFESRLYLDRKIRRRFPRSHDLVLDPDMPSKFHILYGLF